MTNIFTSQEKNKFTKLNFNLKNEIFDFLPFTLKLTKAPLIHKKFTFALNKKKSINFLKQNIKNLQKQYDECPFSKLENLENTWLKEIAGLEAFESSGLISYLVLKSNNFPEEYFDFFKEELSIKYYEFLKFSKSVKILKLFDDGENNENSDEEDENENVNDEFYSNTAVKKVPKKIKSEILNFANIDFVQEFKAILHTNANINTLFFYGFFAVDPAAEMQALKEILANNKSIKSLIFENCKFRNNLESLSILKQILLENKTVTSLTIGRDLLNENPKTLEILEEILTKNKTIKNLKLNHNSIGRSYNAMAYMLRMLKSNKSLEYLDFTENDIKSARNKNIYKQMLEEAKGLKALKFKIEDKGLYYNQKLIVLKEILLKNKRIKELKIEKVNMYRSYQYFKELEEIIKIPSVNSVHLKIKNLVSLDHWKTLNKLILSNPKIKGIKIEKSRVTETKALALIRQAFVDNKHITKLVIKGFNYTYYGRKVFKIFEDVLFQNKNLELFKIHFNNMNCDENRFYFEQFYKLNVNKNLIIKH